MNNFDLRKFLTENKLTSNSMLAENNIQKALNSIRGDVNPDGEAFLEKHGITTREQAIDLLKALRSEYNDWAYEDIAKVIKTKFGGTSSDAADLAIGGKNYSVGEDDPNDDGTITSIEKYPNGYFINGTVYNQDGEEKEGYGYAIDLDGNEMDEEDLQGKV